MRRKNNEITGDRCNRLNFNNRTLLRFFNSRFLVLKNNEGFIDLYTFGIFFIVLTICFASIAGIGFAGHRLAVMTYDWLGSSMNFSSAAASMYSHGTGLILSEPIAKDCFVKTFSEMTNTSYANNAFTPEQDSPYPGKIVLRRFEAVAAFKTGKTGYVAELEVPVIGAKVPFLGYQSIKVPMKYFAVGRNIEI